MKKLTVSFLICFAGTSYAEPLLERSYQTDASSALQVEETCTLNAKDVTIVRKVGSLTSTIVYPLKQNVQEIKRLSEVALDGQWQVPPTGRPPGTAPLSAPQTSWTVYHQPNPTLPHVRSLLQESGRKTGAISAIEAAELVRYTDLHCVR